ncbi:hypothetical protein ACXR2U_22250 [Jatrophihabitans sp. YIM 134969]
MTAPVTDDALDIGREPRPPLSPRTKRAVVAVLALLVVGAVVAVLLVRPGGGDRRRPVADAPTPAPSSSGEFPAGPVLVSVGGTDALQPPGLPGLGSSTGPVTLQPAPELVRVVAAALPGLRDVRGGRTPEDGSRFGFYLDGVYDGVGGPVRVSLYSVVSPGTTYGADRFVSRSKIGQDYRVRTDVSVFTGSGWWVHAVSLGPDDPSALRTGEVARLLPLARDPALVTP